MKFNQIADEILTEGNFDDMHADYQDQLDRELREFLELCDKAYYTFVQSGQAGEIPFTKWLAYDPKGLRFFQEIANGIVKRNPRF